jgi:hypothetical protein
MYRIGDYNKGKCGNTWQVDLATAQHLLSPFSSPFFGVKFLLTMGSGLPPYDLLYSKRRFLPYFAVCFLKALYRCLTNFLFLKFIRGEMAG